MILIIIIIIIATTWTNSAFHGKWKLRLISIEKTEIFICSCHVLSYCTAPAQMAHFHVRTRFKKQNHFSAVTTLKMELFSRPNSKAEKKNGRRYV